MQSSFNEPLCVIERFLTCIEKETCPNTKTDLIHNMYYHLFANDLTKKFGIFTISHQIKALEAQKINMSFWKAKLAQVDWVSPYYTCVANTVNKLIKDIDSEKNENTRANYQYLLFYTVVTHPQLFFMGIDRTTFITYMFQHCSFVEKHTGNNIDNLFQIVNGNTFFEIDSYKELVHDINKLLDRLRTMDPNQLDEKGETLLMEAVRWRKDDAMLYLAHLEVDPNIQNPHGKTAMHMTCGKLHKGKWSYIPILLGLGGNPELKTTKGKDVYSYAQQHFASSTLHSLKSNKNHRKKFLI